jgi:Rieske Fe-S protein
VRRHFKAESIDYRWANEDYTSVDMLPFIGKLDSSAEHIWVATGFNGWGMTGGTMAAMVLTDLIQGKDNPWARLYDSTRDRPTPSAADSAAEFAKENLNVAKEWLKDHILPASKQSVDDVVPGQGAVLRTKEGKVAVFRDQSGNPHAVSAICTHMGCTVAWNSIAGTWDCPCHGSRFDVSGRVLYGPAVRDLERRQIPQAAGRKAS